MKTISCIEFDYIPRSCECCDSFENEELWAYDYETHTRGSVYRFRVRYVICRSCGFIFASPVPKQSELNQYYSDSYSCWSGQNLDYDIGKRLDFIRAQSPGTDSFVEIGSNTRSPFHDKLLTIFARVTTAELNLSTHSEFRSIGDLPSGDADVVAHYFVLEHVPTVNSFLQTCYASLKKGGVMICEVPDLKLYPVDVSGLRLFEHMNHFTIEVLERMASNTGFRLLAHSRSQCSRSFGFAAAFLKTGEPDRSKRLSLWRENRELFEKGREKIEIIQKDLQMKWELLRTYTGRNKKVVLWAANENLMRFLGGRSLPESVQVIDSNPEKKDFSKGAFPVFLPDEARSHIVESEAIFIFSELNQAAILSSIYESFGKSFNPEDIITISG